MIANKRLVGRWFCDRLESEAGVEQRCHKLLDRAAVVGPTIADSLGISPDVVSLGFGVARRVRTSDNDRLETVLFAGGRIFILPNDDVVVDGIVRRHEEHTTVDQTRANSLSGVVSSWR